MQIGVIDWLTVLLACCVVCDCTESQKSNVVHVYHTHLFSNCRLVWGMRSDGDTICIATCLNIDTIVSNETAQFNLSQLCIASVQTQAILAQSCWNLLLSFARGIQQANMTHQTLYTP